jgi:hypothetical protein
MAFVGWAISHRGPPVTYQNAFVFSAAISSNTQNYILNAAAVAAGWNQTQPLQATVIDNAGVYVGSARLGALQ